MKIINVYPDTTAKVLPNEPLTFYVTIEGDAPKKVEIWTDILCDEFGPPPVMNTKVEFAVPLELTEDKGDIKVFSGSVTPIKTGFYSFSVRSRSGKSWKWKGESGGFEKRDITALYVEPAWVSNTVIYNAFVRQFGACDRDGDGIVLPGEGGTFDDLIKRIDHFSKLHIGAIYLNPIQKSTNIHRYDAEVGGHYRDETNHLPLHMHPGSVYSIEDYKSIDPELGLNPEEQETDQYQEFRRFTKECHARGIRVILDVVFDHTARDSFIQRLHPEWFLYKKNPISLEGSYVEYGDSEIWGKPEYVFSPYDHDIFWSDSAFLNWNFRYAPADNDPPPNPRIKEMREYFKSVLKYWIKNYGVDGFRLDVSYAIPPDFWHEALEDCRNFSELVRDAHERNPEKQPQAPLSSDIIFIGETYVDDVFELQECGLSMLNGDFSSKIWNVQTLRGYLDYAHNLSGTFFPRGSRWLLFPECHDWSRLPGKFKDSLHHDYSDVQLNKSRWVLACLLPGTPMLHNGYEVVEHEPLSVRTYTPINWESPKNITDYLAKVNLVRIENVAFQKGTYKFVDTEQGDGEDAQLFCFLRDYRGESHRQTCLTVVNMDFNNSAEGIKVMMPDIEGYDFSKNHTLIDLLTGEKFKRSDRELNVILGPGESHVFEIEQD